MNNKNCESDIQAQRLEYLTEVIKRAIHEINNPLAVIQGNVEVLLRQIKAKDNNAEVAEKTVEKILHRVDRISKIVKGLRQVASDSSTPWEQVPVKSFVDEAIVACQKKIAKLGIQPKVSGSGILLSVHGNMNELIQVMTCLIENACDAVEKLAERKIEIEVKQLDGQIEISVTDSGPGISKGLVDKIMTPFFTTKQVSSSESPGLSISNRIAENHKGKLYLDTNCPNTRFVLQLSHS